MTGPEPGRRTFSAGVTLADRVHVEVIILAPADRPDVDELGELAQMTAQRGAQLVRRSHSHVYTLDPTPHPSGARVEVCQVDGCDMWREAKPDSIPPF